MISVTIPYSPRHPGVHETLESRRFVVLVAHRRFGKTVLAEAERLIRKAGGHVAAVHSEDKNFAMYEHLGYRITSELFDNGTHGWLVKALN